MDALAWRHHVVSTCIFTLDPHALPGLGRFAARPVLWSATVFCTWEGMIVATSVDNTPAPRLLAH